MTNVTTSRGNPRTEDSGLRTERNRRPVRLTRTPSVDPDLNAAFLVSTIFMVDTIFASAQHLLKTVLPGRLQTVVEVPLLHPLD